MSLTQPRPGDLWFETMLDRWPGDEQATFTEIFVLVTGSPDVHALGGHSIPVFPVLMSTNVRCITGHLLESRPPHPRTFGPVDFEKMELLSRSDEESEEDHAGEDIGWIFEFDGVRCVKVRQSVVE